MTAELPVVRLSSRGVRRLRTGHPWIFRDDVADASQARHGDLVRLAGPGGHEAGYAFHSARSKIALRIVAGPGPVPDEGFWAARVADAREHRRRVVSDTDAWRVVFGEADGIPGLVADRYGDHLVVQVLTAATERLLPVLLEALSDDPGLPPPASILARNDPSVRTLEGLPREVHALRGTPPERIEVREGPIRYSVDPWHGQKTGAFLDQRENRAAAAGWCRGRVLDVFCYQGLFALHAARAGAEVEGIDASEGALAAARAHADANGLTVAFTAGNAFDLLRARQEAGEAYDAVILDPPAFAKSRADLPAALRGYKEINLRALRLLRPGGVLLTSSCSYHLSEPDLLAVVGAAAADAGCGLRVVDRRMQSRDHPVRAGFPESHYLKCLILTRD